MPGVEHGGNNASRKGMATEVAIAITKSNIPHRPAVSGPQRG